MPTVGIAIKLSGGARVLFRVSNCTSVLLLHNSDFAQVCVVACARAYFT
jgi:hypothetical protein